MPGLGIQSDAADMDEVSINFARQRSHSSLETVPLQFPDWRPDSSTARTFWFTAVGHPVAPAVSAAKNGVPVTTGFERVCDLLWPILERSDAVRALFSCDGRPLQEGDTFYCHELADTLEQFGATGHSLFADGDVGQAILAHLDGASNLTESDLRYQKARISPALEVPYRNAKLWIPNAPSVAGISLAHSLCELEACGPFRSDIGRHRIEHCERTASDI